MKPRTLKMQQCMAAIRRLTVDGVPPTLQRLADELGLISKGHVHDLLVEMRARGLVTWEPKLRGTLRIVEGEISRSDLAELCDDRLLELIGWARSILAERP